MKHVLIVYRRNELSSSTLYNIDAESERLEVNNCSNEVYVRIIVVSCIKSNLNSCVNLRGCAVRKPNMPQSVYCLF